MLRGFKMACTTVSAPLFVCKEHMLNRQGSLKNRYEELLGFSSFAEAEKSTAMPFTISSFLFDKPKTSGKGILGLAEKVFLAVHHHFMVEGESDKEKGHIRDVEFLTSRFADREMRENEVVHLQDGYFYVDRLFAKRGAYVVVLIDIENTMPPKIVCRGTALRSNATVGYASGVNDLQMEAGIEGVAAIWPALSEYLKGSGITEVEVLGKSLGGAHAQLLAVLIEGTLSIKIKRLITYCSIGISRDINQLFCREILAKRSEPFQIEVIRNGGTSLDEIDFVPLVGDLHLGAGYLHKTIMSADDKRACQVTMSYIHTENTIRSIPVVTDFLSSFKQFTRSFGGSHCRQSTLDQFFVKTITDPAEIDGQLEIPNHLEPVRQVVSSVLNFISAGELNKWTFQRLYAQR